MKRSIRNAVAVSAVALFVFACARKESAPPHPAQRAAQVVDTGALASLIPPYEDQAASYSVKNCLVCGMSLADVKKPVDAVQSGKLARFCSDACAAKFVQSPERYLAARDSLLIATQLPSYPTDKCVVTEDKLDAFGTPKNILWGTRLVRLCCKNCEDNFRENPADFVAALDALSDVKSVETTGQTAPAHSN